MGCCTQRADYQVTEGEFLAAKSLTGKVTEDTTYYKLKQKFWSWTEDYTIKDSKDNQIMRVGGKLLTLRDGKTAFDMNDQKLAYFQNKLMSMHSNYYVFSYEPVCEGQESTEKDADDVPVYRYAKIEKDICSCRPRFTMYMFTSNEDCHPIIRSEGTCFSCRFNMKIMMHKDRPNGRGNMPIVGQLGEQTILEWGHENWGIKLAKGMDPILSIIFCIAVEDILKDEEKN